MCLLNNVHLTAASPVGDGLYSSRTKIYESNRTLNNNVELVPAVSTTKTVTSNVDIDKELQDIALSDGILPAPGTKVTTTVRTYTYEIPSNGPSSSTNTINRSSNNNTLSSSYSKHHETHNSSQNYTQLSPRSPTVPQTVVYNTESYSTLNPPHDRPIVSNQSYEIREHKETTTRGLSPQPRQLPLGPAGSPNGVPPNSSRTVIYNIHKTDNVNNVISEPRYPQNPAHSPNYGSPHSPAQPQQQLPPGGTNRYYYKETETSNTVNTIHGPPNGSYAPLEPAHSAPLKQLPTSGYPPQPQTGNGYPPNTSYTYKYSSTTNTTNNRRGPGPDYGSPSPFPVDGVEYPVANANPPQRVDDLMQSFGTVSKMFPVSPGYF